TGVSEKISVHITRPKVRIKRDLYFRLAPLCEPPLIACAPSRTDEAFILVPTGARILIVAADLDWQVCRDARAYSAQTNNVTESSHRVDGLPVECSQNGIV
ncbi:MAG: hypothetical protein ACRCZ5_09640, partial [Burkholderiales bacterium]